jgi:hypothetical protein
MEPHPCRNHLLMKCVILDFIINFYIPRLKTQARTLKFFQYFSGGVLYLILELVFHCGWVLAQDIKIFNPYLSGITQVLQALQLNILLIFLFQLQHAVSKSTLTQLESFTAHDKFGEHDLERDVEYRGNYLDETMVTYVGHSPTLSVAFPSSHGSSAGTAVLEK